MNNDSRVVSIDRTAVLLVNLGTPEAPTVPAVRRYLKQFLSDPKVIDCPAWMRKLIVNLCILPFRPKYSAKLYQKIWTPNGSPLLINSQALLTKLRESLGEGYAVALGMRYGKPSIESALNELQEKNCRELIVLPLFPQFSSSVTESALDEVRAKSLFERMIIIDSFFKDPHYIDSMATVIREHLTFQADYFLWSYHGLPSHHLNRSCQLLSCDQENPCPAISSANFNCYRAQCFTTARLLAQKLNLTEQQYGVAFQSRLGRTSWIKPYTDKYLTQLAQRNIKKLVVFCPSFVADCLETLEEIGIRADAQWRELGGDVLKLIPALNSHPRWISAVTTLIKQAEESC